MMERLAQDATTEKSITPRNTSSEDVFSSQTRSSTSFNESRNEESARFSISSALETSLDVSIRKPIFSLVDVTKTPKLWSVFQREFESFLCSKSDSRSHQLAIQPHWQVFGERDTCNRVLPSKGVFVWHDGCAGSSCYGGGNSGVCLQLKGLTISSTDLQPQHTVFWLPLQTGNINVLKGIRSFLSHRGLKIIVWDLKWWIRVCNELLNVDTETVEGFYDPGIQGWMENPDSGRSRLVDVLPDASRVIGALFSMGYYLDPPTQLSDWNRLQLVSMPSTSNFAQETPYSLDVLNTAAQCYLLSLAPLQPAISL
ncbi:unnamed protein product, partial [Hymenolepis diminuta]